MSLEQKVAPWFLLGSIALALISCCVSLWHRGAFDSSGGERFERSFMARCLSDGRTAFECEVLCRELDRGGKGCL